MKTMSKVNNIILSICEIIIGILILVDPIGLAVGTLTFLGIVLLIIGVCNTVRYFTDTPEKAAAGHSLTGGLIEILLGIFCIFRNKWFIATFPLLTVLYGIGTLIIGIAKIQLTADMIRLKLKKWFWAAISSVLTILCAVIIICNPFSTTAVLWMFIGITLIVEAFLDIISTIFTKSDKSIL